MVELLTMESVAALLTLTVLEIVLGIDNVVFIALLVGRLPERQRAKARTMGLLLAMGTRILLLLCIKWIMGLGEPWFTLFAHTFSGRDLILLLGGGFLVYKATVEIHDKLEGSKETLHQPKAASYGSVLAQVVALDIVFSLDSVITAVGMVKAGEGQTWQPLAIMIAAIIIAIFVMIAFSGAIARFIEEHPTTKMLALAFLLLIGVVLVAESFHQEIPRGYIYTAMAFSVFVEMLNLRIRRKKVASKA